MIVRLEGQVVGLIIGWRPACVGHFSPPSAIALPVTVAAPGGFTFTTPSEHLHFR